MEWYVPITIMPAIGLIIMSTTNFIVALNAEIFELEKDITQHDVVINGKIKQLKRLGTANALLYMSALCFMFAALFQASYDNEIIFQCIMITATVLVTIAFIFLFLHSVNAIQIRGRHLKK